MCFADLAAYEPRRSRDGICSFGSSMEQAQCHQAKGTQGGESRESERGVEKKGIQPPTSSGFDYEQDAIRKGSSLFIKLLDGTERRVGTWNPVKNEFK